MGILPRMQKLITYLREKQITQSSFAGRIGITQAALSRMLSGQIAPSLETAVKIQRETDGAVKADEWVAPQIQDKAS
jgi:transcriptional regulator with XRE-family HTH domain